MSAPTVADVVATLVAALGERGVVIRVEPVSGAYSAEQAAEWLNVSAATVRRMMADGRLPFVSLGSKRRIARSVLERLVDPERAQVAS